MYTELRQDGGEWVVGQGAWRLAAGRACGVPAFPPTAACGSSEQPGSMNLALRRKSPLAAAPASPPAVPTLLPDKAQNIACQD